MEVDPPSACPECLDEQLAWTRGRGGDFRKSALAQVDAELRRRFKDYLGFSVVFSGNKSLHVHFVFSTAHLVGAPADADAGQRVAPMHEGQAALLRNAHAQCWDRVHDVFVSVLKPSTWARQKASVIDPASADAVGASGVGQGLHHRTARRNARSSDRRPRAHPRPGWSECGGVLCSAGLLARPSGSVARAVCAWFGDAERVRGTVLCWSVRRVRNDHGGARALPCGVGRVSEARRHDASRTGTGSCGSGTMPATSNPSTIVQGDYRRLLSGRHSFQQDFYLPEGMTANEFGDHLAICFGLKSPLVVEADAAAEPESEPAEPLSLMEKMKAAMALPIDEIIRRSIERHFPEPLSDKPLSEIRTNYRAKLGAVALSVSDVRRSPDGEIRSRDRAKPPPCSISWRMKFGMRRFAGRSTVSNGSPSLPFALVTKRRNGPGEFRQKGRKVAVVRTFWDHYERPAKKSARRRSNATSLRRLKPGGGFGSNPARTAGGF